MKSKIAAVLVTSALMGQAVAQASFEAEPLRLKDGCLNQIYMITSGSDYNETASSEVDTEQKAFLNKAEAEARTIATDILSMSSVDVAISSLDYVSSVLVNAHDHWFGAKVVLGHSKNEVENQHNRVEVLFLAEDLSLSGDTGLIPLTAVVRQHVGNEPEFILCGY